MDLLQGFECVELEGFGCMRLYDVFKALGFSGMEALRVWVSGTSHSEGSRRGTFDFLGLRWAFPAVRRFYEPLTLDPNLDVLCRVVFC